jgi:Lanthionine synthetase C-like protein
MVEADPPAAEHARWQALVRDGVQALFDDMAPDPDAAHWLWRQDLYGRIRHHVGAGHGLAGNAYPALRAAGLVDATVADTLLQRCFDTLSATALQAVTTGPDGGMPVVNWHPVTERERIAAALATGQRPLVQDCHGAPGGVCRLATAPAAWDTLLRAAGEMTWIAGPLAKGPSLCHGTAGNAMACLKLWQRLRRAAVAGARTQAGDACGRTVRTGARPPRPGPPQHVDRRPGCGLRAVELRARRGLVPDARPPLSSALHRRWPAQRVRQHQRGGHAAVRGQCVDHALQVGRDGERPAHDEAVLAGHAHHVQHLGDGVEQIDIASDVFRRGVRPHTACIGRPMAAR